RIGESHDRRRGAGAFRVLDHPAILAVHHSDAGIGRTEVDADYFCHVLLSAKQAFKDPIPAFRRKPPFARNFASARRAPRHALVAAYIRSTNFGCKSPASPLRLPARAIQYGHCDPAPCHRHPAKGHIGLASGKRRASVAARWQRRIPDLRRIRVRTPAVGLALVLFIVIFAVAGLFVWQGYRDALVRGEQRAAIAAHTIAAHFQWIIEASRQALRRTDDTLGFRPQIWNNDGIGDISDAVAGLPATVDVRVFDAAGEEVLTTRPQAGELSVGDRPYFPELKSGRRLIVSRLLVDRVTGDASFVVAQRLEREGGFAGIAAIVIPSSLISEFWASLELGTDSTASIIRDDGWLVTRHPPRSRRYQRERRTAPATICPESPRGLLRLDRVRCRHDHAAGGVLPGAQRAADRGRVGVQGDGARRVQFTASQAGDRCPAGACRAGRLRLVGRAPARHRRKAARGTRKRKRAEPPAAARGPSSGQEQPADRRLADPAAGDPSGSAT